MLLKALSLCGLTSKFSRILRVRKLPLLVPPLNFWTFHIIIVIVHLWVTGESVDYLFSFYTVQLRFYSVDDLSAANSIHFPLLPSSLSPFQESANMISPLPSSLFVRVKLLLPLFKPFMSNWQKESETSIQLWEWEDDVILKERRDSIQVLFSIRSPVWVCVSLDHHWLDRSLLSSPLCWELRSLFFTQTHSHFFEPNDLFPSLLLELLR